MLNILVKDFKLLLFGDKSSIGKKILSLVFTALFSSLHAVKTKRSEKMKNNPFNFDIRCCSLNIF